MQLLLNYITWDVSPVMIDAGDFIVRWYGAMFLLAFLVGYFIMRYILKREGYKAGLIDNLFLYMFAAVLIGGRLGHVFFYDWAYYSQNIGEIVQFWKGGMASHGAAIGIIAAMLLFAKYELKSSPLWPMDRVIIVVALGSAFIRFGNLMNQEIVGSISTVPWAFIFPRVDMHPRHPAQLYEALACLLIFAILVVLYRKDYAKKMPGFMLGVYLALTFTMRFLVEFVKADQVAFEADMTLNMGQWLSIPLVLLGLFFIIRAIRNKEKTAITATT